MNIENNRNSVFPHPVSLNTTPCNVLDTQQQNKATQVDDAVPQRPALTYTARAEWLRTRVEWLSNYMTVKNVAIASISAIALASIAYYTASSPTREQYLEWDLKYTLETIRYYLSTIVERDVGSATGSIRDCLTKTDSFKGCENIQNMISSSDSGANIENGNLFNFNGLVSKCMDSFLQVIQNTKEPICYKLDYQINPESHNIHFCVGTAS